MAFFSITLTLLYTGATSFVSTTRQQAGTTQVSFSDLTPINASPRGHHAGEKLLVLTPLKDAEPWLDEYFENLAR